MTELPFDPYRRACPSRTVLDRVADRWTVLVVGALEGGPLRFSHLTQRVDGVSQKMLTQTLRGLERDGLVRRTVHAEVPPRVEYELTDAGRAALEPLRALERWTLEHAGEVLAAREAYDARNG
ncbi:helix-turn-helix domain-containing protein [Isoptericola variabilis]|uniref:Transcriptional regulator, HxlR family n=1 Tax=Isoptericola variabilis (strain 225) TaxID=743718 RepID=F6FSM2_ISOV2|nr:helix-turn-helix domain-containing protein [Isoptericola variabilis]AEG45184.1 transcriptional regulator, HxlR family [Isoptericola variabilis 225]TWH34001.1 HxlR family transcriptional regulator [Isoptericola variabilis J7]